MFETFSDVFGNYPKMVASSVLQGPLPTNSWIENAIVDNVPINNRFFNTIPWTWTVHYANDNPPNQYIIDHSSFIDSITTISQGNLAQIQGRATAFTVSSLRSSAPSLRSSASSSNIRLIEVSDMAAVFDGGISAYPLRGSVLQTFMINDGTSLNLLVNGGIGNLQTSTVGPLTKITFDLNRSKSSFGNTNVFALNHSDLASVRCWFYRDFVRYEETGFVVNVALASQRGDNDAHTMANMSTIFTLFGITYTVSSNNTTLMHTVNAPADPNRQSITVDVKSDSTGIVLIFNSGEVFEIVVSAVPPPPIPLAPVTPIAPVPIISVQRNVLVTTRYSRPVVQHVVLYGSFFELSGNTFTFGSGVFQIANADDARDTDAGAGQYYTSGVVDNYFNDGFGVTYQGPGSDVLTYLPNHWFQYQQAGITNLGSVLTNMIYGDLRLVRMRRSVALHRPTSIPGFSSIEPLPSGIQSSMISDIDTAWSYMSQFDTYAFGQSSFALVRLLLYARASGVSDTHPSITRAKEKLLLFMTNWMTGTNNVTYSVPANGCNQNPGFPEIGILFHLQYESYWKGIIVPADYLNINQGCYYRLSSFGNSYYNDHHFHYGYIFYTAAAMIFLGINLDSFRERLTYLLMDVVSPDSSTFIKTRHKDWYGGHSLATGFEPSPLIGQSGYVGPEPVSGPVQRQQESCSEAIHCYYGAYLLSSAMGITDISLCASACLVTEIDAIQQYYYLQAPNSRTGVLGAGIGILFTDSKQVTLDWGTQPDSHNGRMCGIYGIQSLPFTEISYQQITTDWVDRCATYAIASFRMDQSLVEGLVLSIYTPALYINEVILVPYNAAGGRIWGAIGAKILAFGSPATLANSVAQEIYTELQKGRLFDFLQDIYQRVTHQFDSITHTYYIMRRKMMNFDNGTIIIGNIRILDTGNENGTTTSTTNRRMLTSAPSDVKRSVLNGAERSDGLPFPTPTCSELLNESSLRLQCLIRVPLVFAGVRLTNNNTTIETSYFQVIDRYAYCNGKISKRKETCTGLIGDVCPVQSAKDCDVIVSNLKSNLNTVVTVNAPGSTFQEKSQALPGSNAQDLLSYSVIKLGLARILFGDFSLSYLTQSFNDRFFERLLASRFCNLAVTINTLYPNYNRFFIP